MHSLSLLTLPLVPRILLAQLQGSDVPPSFGNDTLQSTWDGYNHDIHQAIHTPTILRHRAGLKLPY